MEPFPPPLTDIELSHPINPPHLIRLKWNPNYEEVKLKNLQIGDEVVVGRYASNHDGSPNIRWTEEIVTESLKKGTGIPIIEIRRKKFKM